VTTGDLISGNFCRQKIITATHWGSQSGEESGVLRIKSEASLLWSLWFAVEKAKAEWRGSYPWFGDPELELQLYVQICYYTDIV
jgi:hypothetical protein